MNEMYEGNLVAIRPGEREPASFGALLERLISAMYRLQIVADHFGDLADMPQKHVPGAYVVAEAAAGARASLRRFRPLARHPRAHPEGGAIP
jgi:hypothetical protein